MCVYIYILYVYVYIEICTNMFSKNPFKRLYNLNLNTYYIIMIKQFRFCVLYRIFFFLTESNRNAKYNNRYFININDIKQYYTLYNLKIQYYLPKVIQNIKNIHNNSSFYFQGLKKYLKILKIYKCIIKIFNKISILKKTYLVIYFTNIYKTCTCVTEQKNINKIHKCVIYTYLLI
ncbi:hypothetical protein AGLY_002669 [Aphis glycines]|uniref:Uncharacterized protein n=1 Tax=Aphis glycines TaxID=307491 RepID=A0A6G0U0W7_APHGL|nr:hypothetical protein AGLY_002669 [Aphis glycines]